MIYTTDTRLVLLSTQGLDANTFIPCLSCPSTCVKTDKSNSQKKFTIFRDFKNIPNFTENSSRDF